MNVDLGKINKELSREINKLQGENDRLKEENKKLREELSVYGNGRMIPIRRKSVENTTTKSRAKRMKPEEVFEIVKPYLEHKEITRKDVEKIPGITCNQFDNMISKFSNVINIRTVKRKHYYSMKT